MFLSLISLGRQCYPPLSTIRTTTTPQQAQQEQQTMSSSSSPNLKAAAAAKRAKAAWSLSSATEMKKLGTSSPSWRGLALGSPNSLPRTRGLKSHSKRLFFGDSSSGEDSSPEITPPPLSKKQKRIAEIAEHRESALSGRAGSTKSNRRLILEEAPLKLLIESNSACRDCGSPLEVDFDTCCIASWIKKLSCSNSSCGYIHHGEKPQQASLPYNPDKDSTPLVQKTTDYAVNIQYILGLICSRVLNPR